MPFKAFYTENFLWHGWPISFMWMLSGNINLRQSLRWFHIIHPWSQDHGCHMSEWSTILKSQYSLFSRFFFLFSYLRLSLLRCWIQCRNRIKRKVYRVPGHKDTNPIFIPRKSVEAFSMWILLPCSWTEKYLSSVYSWWHFAGNWKRLQRFVQFNTLCNEQTIYHLYYREYKMISSWAWSGTIVKGSKWPILNSNDLSVTQSIEFMDT
jgi:hypothetical protein